MTGTASIVAPSVVFVDHTSRPGGAELSLVRYLEQHDPLLDVRLVVFEPGYLADRAHAAGVDVVALPPARSMAGRLAALQRALPAESLVVANSLKSAVYLSLLPQERRRFIYYLREDLSPEWLRGPKRLVALQACLRRFDGFLANSAWTGSTLPPHLARKGVEIAHPVSGTRELAPVARPSGGPLRILSLSRLSEWKGVHVLVAALERLAAAGHGARFEVTIAGDDVFRTSPYVERLRDAATASGVRVSFPGHLEDVSGVLEDHDVLVSCSLLAEPFGQVVAQGLAHGLAVVSTDMGGPREMITDGRSGRLVPPNDPAALADALLALEREPAALAAMQGAARTAARRFLDAETVPRLDDVLRAHLGALRPGRPVAVTG